MVKNPNKELTKQDVEKMIEAIEREKQIKMSSLFKYRIIDANYLRTILITGVTAT